MCTCALVHLIYCLVARVLTGRLLADGGTVCVYTHDNYAGNVIINKQIIDMCVKVGTCACVSAWLHVHAYFKVCIS